MERVVLLERDALSQYGLRAMVSEFLGIEVVGVCEDIAQCEAVLRRMAVDTLIVNTAATEHADLFGLVKHWRRLAPGLRIVVISRRLSVRFVRRLMAAQVSGYIHRDECNRAVLQDCLFPRHRGQIYISPNAGAQLIRRQDGRYVDRDGSEKEITPNELDVLYGLADGMNVQEIADLMGVTVGVVYRYRGTLRQHLDVSTNEQILPAARRLGLLVDPL